MKSGNYDDLIDKFYTGIASAVEINLLKKEGLLDEQDILYANALKSERGQKMSWEFEDFMKEIPQGKVVAIPGSIIWLKRIISVAAVVAAILTVYIFWPQQHQTKEIANVPAINKPGNSKMIPDFNPALRQEIEDSVVLTEKVKVTSKIDKVYAVKGSKQIPVKGIRHTQKENVETKTNVEDYFVMVNGIPITNEEDAIAITRESLGMFSRNLTTAIDELKPIGRIKIKL